jgi:ribonuclease BN (tRNA processing enzyme)
MVERNVRTARGEHVDGAHRDPVLRLTVLGSGTLVADGRRGPAGYAMEHGATRLVLDGGTGTLRRLAEMGIDYRSIDHLLYTHVHPDHTGDLVPFLFSQRHTPGFERRRALRLSGPRGFAAFVRQLLAIYGRWVESPDYAIQVEEHWGDAFEIAALAITTARMRHPVACIGYRLTAPDGSSIAYTGDTDATDGIVELAADVDVLVADCSTPDAGKVEGHLSPGPLGELAQAAGARRLVLSHLYPVCDGADLVGECRRHFRGEVLVAHDGLVVEVAARRVTVSVQPIQVWPTGLEPQGGATR